MIREPIYKARWISSAALEFLYENYQRFSNDSRVARIVAEFDERVANEPKVSERDGHYYVFDGQHTIMARVVRNGGKPLKILCKVYSGLSEREEAHLFAMQTGTSSLPTWGERFRARLAANDEEAWDFKRITESAGIHLALSGERSDWHIGCGKTAETAYTHFGEESYLAALFILADAWKACSDALRHEIIKGICRFVWVYQDDFVPERLIRGLKKHDPSEIRDRIRADIHTPDIWKHVKPFWEIYNAQSPVGMLPEKS